MATIFQGARGSGKSFRLVTELVNFFLLPGRPTASNIRLNHPFVNHLLGRFEQHRSLDNSRSIYFIQLPPVFHGGILQVLKGLGGTEQDPGGLFIDEAFFLLGTKSSTTESKNLFKEFLINSRKEGWLEFYGVHRIEQLEKQFRDNYAETEKYCTTLSKVIPKDSLVGRAINRKFPAFYRLSFMKTLSKNDVNPNATKKKGWLPLPAIIDDFAGCYNTNEYFSGNYSDFLIPYEHEYEFWWAQHHAISGSKKVIKLVDFSTVYEVDCRPSDCLDCAGNWYNSEHQDNYLNQVEGSRPQQVNIFLVAFSLFALFFFSVIVGGWLVLFVIQWLSSSVLSFLNEKISSFSKHSGPAGPAAEVSNVNNKPVDKKSVDSTPVAGQKINGATQYPFQLDSPYSPSIFFSKFTKCPGGMTLYQLSPQSFYFYFRDNEGKFCDDFSSLELPAINCRGNLINDQTYFVRCQFFFTHPKFFELRSQEVLYPVVEFPNIQQRAKAQSD